MEEVDQNTKIHDQMANSYDTTHSLHHIPNYLWAIWECMRVLKPGWFLYIDHEHSQEYRSNKESFNDLYSSTDQKTLLEKIVHLVTSPRLFLKHCTIRRKRLFDKRYQYEWDIHVRDDDHIQREKISMVVSEFWELYKSQTYLLYRKWFDMNQYLWLKNSQHDMQRSLYRKNVL